MNRRMRHGAAVVALCCTTGCYTFRPAQPDALGAGSTIRVTVTPEEAARQRDRVGMLTEELEGRLLTVASDSLGLAIREWQGSPADRPDFSAYITVPRDAIVQVQEKHLSIGRTAAFAGAAFAVAAALLAIGVSSSGDNGEPPPTTELIPLLRLFVR